MGSTTPNIMGRDRTLLELRRAVERTAATGRGSCVVINGSAGIGKSALTRAVTAGARESGFAVAAGTTAPLDRDVPLSTLRGLLHSNIPARLHPLLAGHDDPLGAVDRIIDLLGPCARRQPVLVALDDAHLADNLSAAALRVLVSEVASLPVLWLLTRRPGSVRGVAQDTLDWLVRQGAACHDLGPLCPDVVTALCADFLGARPDDGVLALAARGGGNPFLVRELLATSLAEGRIRIAHGAATLTDNRPAAAFGCAVDHLLRDLSDDVRRVLDAVAVLETPFSVHEAAGLLGRPPVELLPVISELVGASVLVDDGASLAFRHDLVREAMYARLSEPVRTALHREAASAVWREGRSAAEFVEHLMRGKRRGETFTSAVWRPATRTRITSSSPVLVVRDRHSRADDHDEPVHPELMADAMHLMGATGLRDLDDWQIPGQRGHAAQVSRQADFSQSAHNRRFEKLMYGTAVRSSAARAQGHLGKAVEHALEASRIADSADSADGGVDPGHHRLWLAVALTASDEFDRAEAIFAEKRDPSDHAALRWVLPMWHFHRAELKLASGALAEANAEAATAVRVTKRLAVPSLGVGPLALLARVAIHRNDLSLARAHVTEAEGLGAGATGAGLEDLAWVTALLQSATDDPTPAIDTLSDLYRRLPRRPLLLTKEPHAGACLVRTALSAGDSARAGAVADTARLIAERNPGVASAVAAAAHAEGVLCNDVSRLRTAVSYYRSSPRPLSLAAAAEDLATAEHAQGQRGTAAGLLNEALRHYTAHGARHDALRVRRALQSLGVRRKARDAAGGGRTGWEHLTPSELRVVRLVAQGLTNREAAEKLFLSPHTVDSHLRHSFTKLGVTSRVELTRQVLAHEGSFLDESV
ncbi:helix-turn-helix transcriptional regulator [Streptomyces sp. SID1121]|uniref:helix-turn-helix transcriptional regulator n=1 Tax=Streptomyces sp. SID1121 TaxID=3425888 RepID=UPI0040562F05